MLCVDDEAIAMTVADGSYAARWGVARLSRACGDGDARSQSRIVLSREQERKVSELGHTVRVVTGAVWPLKYRRNALS